jgi:hypothetical protein
MVNEGNPSSTMMARAASMIRSRILSISVEFLAFFMSNPLSFILENKSR